MFGTDHSALATVPFCLPRDRRRRDGRPRSGFAFGVFPAEPVVGGFAGGGGVELSDVGRAGVGREILQFAGAGGRRGADLHPDLATAHAGGFR